jgi:hypothetical protein
MNEYDKFTIFLSTLQSVDEAKSDEYGPRD